MLTTLLQKKPFSSSATVALFNYYVFVTAQVWLIPQCKKRATVNVYHTRQNLIRQQYVISKPDDDLYIAVGCGEHLHPAQAIASRDFGSVVERQVT